MRRVQLQGGARRPHTRRTPCTLSVRPRAPTKQVGLLKAPAAKGGGMESYGPTVLRVFLGVIYIMHAYLAAFVFGPSGMAAYQTAKGIPFPEIGAWYVIVAHGLGGICLLLGVLVRVAALVNIPIMAGALFFVHLKQRVFMGQDGGCEDALPLLCAASAQAPLGARALTLPKEFL